MSTHYGWERGHTANYHSEPNGPVTHRDCVLIEDPFYVSAWHGWYVMLDKIPGPVPFRQISAPADAGGRRYIQSSLIPDLMLHGLNPPGKSGSVRRRIDP